MPFTSQQERLDKGLGKFRGWKASEVLAAASGFRLEFLYVKGPRLSG